MKDLLPHIQKWFLQKAEHFAVFSAADTRIEGWFKAEMLVLLNRLLRQNQVDEYEREANITCPKDGKRKQIDFRIRVHGETHLCELKALCISRAAGTPRNLHFYFRDDDLGLVKDFKKLDELPGGNKWMLGLCRHEAVAPVAVCLAFDDPFLASSVERDRSLENRWLLRGLDVVSDGLSAPTEIRQPQGPSLPYPISG